MCRLRFPTRRLALGAILLAGLALLPAGVAAFAASPDKTMLLLEPTERMEQRCNARAMGEVSRQHPGMHPDELVAYAFSDTRIRDDQVTAAGAAVRSGGHWYHLSYRCVTKDEGLGIETLTYVLGDQIPRDDWDAHGLVP